VARWVVSSTTTPFSGAAPCELAVLRDAFAGALLDGSVRLVTLVGVSGIGKSRLAAHEDSPDWPRKRANSDLIACAADAAISRKRKPSVAPASLFESLENRGFVRSAVAAPPSPAPRGAGAGSSAGGFRTGSAHARAPALQTYAYTSRVGGV
jgi:hypothetical protein